MSEDTLASGEALKAFNNRVFSTWDRLIDQFFEKCETEARAAGLSDEDVNRALWRGYGGDIADAWNEWVNAE